MVSWMSETRQCRVCNKWIKPHSLGPHYRAEHRMADKDVKEIIALARDNTNRGIAWLAAKTGRGQGSVRTILLAANIRMKGMMYQVSAWDAYIHTDTAVATKATQTEHLDTLVEMTEGTFVQPPAPAPTSEYTPEQFVAAYLDKLDAMKAECEKLRQTLEQERFDHGVLVAALEKARSVAESEIQQLSLALNELALGNKSWQDRLAIAGIELGLDR
jgi:hypothetical protein